MFEENDAPNAGGNDAIGPLPTNAPAAPPVPTSPAPAAPAAPAKVSSPMSASPEQPAPLPVSPAAPSRSFMGALAHALIGSTMAVAAKGIKAAAGPAPADSYSTDANGKMTPNYAVDNTRTRLERLAQHALEGLAAGSQIGPQKSKAAAWGAGIGAGQRAEMQQAQQQDLLKRQQAQEDYETQQKTILHKATVAMTNAQTHATWQKFADDENAKDTERQQNTGIVNSLNDFIAQNPTSKLTVQTLTEEQAMAMRETDSHTVAKHTFLPMGKTQAKDANGNDVYEADGQTPKFVKQFAAIGGSADEKVPLPQVMADDVKKYAKYDPRLKSFAQVQAGTMVPFTGFLTAYKYATEDKGREADGWKDPEGKNSVSVEGKIMQHNPFTTETREYPGGVPLGAQKTQADIAEKESAAKKNLADAAAKAQDGLSTNADRAIIAESMRKGRMDPSQLSKRSKDYNAVLAEADKQEMEETGQHFNIAQAQTDYKYANNAQTKNTLNMINGMTEPNGAIDIASRAASRLPKMNSKTANQVFNIAKTEFGDSSLTDFHTAMLGLADEYSKVMGGGVSSDTGRQQALDILKENYSKGQLAGAIQIMKSDISARKKAIVGKNRYLLQEYGEDQTGSQGGQPQSGRPASTPTASGNDPFAQFGGKVRQ